MGDARDPSDADSASSLVTKKREFLESFFKKGAEFTRELLRDNDRLRSRLVQLEEQLRPLLDRLHELDDDDDRFTNRFQEIERENNDLASLFVAQGQLFASLDVREVVQVFIEILLNFVGAQRFALLLADSEGALRVLATEGIDPDTVPVVRPGDATRLGEILATGGMVVEPDAPEQRRDPAVEDPTVCFALAVGGRVVGAVPIWCFLPQKEQLEELDRRIFELLWNSGGRALEAARLASLARGGHEADSTGHSGMFEQYAALMV